MNKLVASAASNKSLETEGTWLKFTVDGETLFPVKLRRAGASNPLFMKTSEEVLREYRMGGVPLDKIEPTRQRELTRIIFARSVIADWDSEVIGEPFSVEAAINTMKESTEFQDWVVTQANTAEHFRAKAIEASAGN